MACTQTVKEPSQVFSLNTPEENITAKALAYQTDKVHAATSQNITIN